MNTFDLPSNSNYGDQPIPITFPDNWDVHISKIRRYDTPALTEAQIAEKIHAAIGAKPISEAPPARRAPSSSSTTSPARRRASRSPKAVIAELRAAGVPKENSGSSSRSAPTASCTARSSCASSARRSSKLRGAQPQPVL